MKLLNVLKSGPSLSDVHVPSTAQLGTQRTPSKSRRRKPSATLREVLKAGGKGYNPYRGAGGRFTSGSGGGGGAAGAKAERPVSAKDRELTARYEGMAQRLKTSTDPREKRALKHQLGVINSKLTTHRINAARAARAARMLEPGEVPGGRAHVAGSSTGFEYASNGSNIYRRPVSHKGTYGGWRWEREDTPHDRKALTDTQGVRFL